MVIEDHDAAERALAQLNYYRLSGYWYPMRCFDGGKGLDEFMPDASFNLVLDLYSFDEQLRHAVFAELDRIEMAVRAMLGYELGRLDPLIHLDLGRMGAPARQPAKGHSDRCTIYEVWLRKYKAALDSSTEDFVSHHKNKYNGILPIWAAVEAMDWGMLSYLYKMSPNRARNNIAKQCGLNAPQLESWLKSLNILRNYAAHHARMFNRVYDIKPKLSHNKDIQAIRGSINKIFGQLTLIQYLHRVLGLSPANRLPKILHTYPNNRLVPLSRTGAPDNWQSLELWQIRPSLT